MKNAAWVLAALSVCALCSATRGEMGGEASRTMHYRASLKPAGESDRPLQLSIEFDPILFSVTTLQNKYRVVALRAENFTAASIKLSVRDDAIELRTGSGKVVKGIFNLQTRDSEVWDALSAEHRKALAYPLSFPASPSAGETGARAGVVSFFAFFPAADANEPPEIFHYTIQSLGVTAEMKKPAVAKR
jgi:hypothetical protein